MNQLNKFVKGTPFKTMYKSLVFSNQQNYHFPQSHAGEIHHNVKLSKIKSLTCFQPGLTAKRIIRVVGERLRKIDPARWETVPITFKTHWRSENGYCDVSTSIHIHDALEKEFSMDIKDRCILITDVETAFYTIMQHHDAL